MTVYLSRFGHAAKVYIAVLAIIEVLLAVAWVAEIFELHDWILQAVTLALLFSATLYFLMSHKIWYDDIYIYSKVSGGRLQRLEFATLTRCERVVRVPDPTQLRPIRVIAICGDVAAEEPIYVSLKHFALTDIAALLTAIHDRTGLAVPALPS